MFFIILNYFFISIYCLNIGYVYNTHDQHIKDISEQYIADINKNYKSQQILIPFLYNDGDDFNSLKSDILSKDLNGLIIDCNSVSDDKIDELENEGIFVICLSKYSIGRCTNKRINGVSIIPSIEKCIYYIILLVFFILAVKNNTNIAIILDHNEDLVDYYMERIIHLVDMYHFNIVYDKTDGFDTSDIPEYITKLKEYNDGVVTLLLHKKLDVITQLLTDKAADSLTAATNYRLIYLEGSIELHDLVGGSYSSIASANEGNYYITGFDYSKTDTDYYLHYYHNTDSIDPYKESLMYYSL